MATSTPSDETLPLHKAVVAELTQLGGATSEQVDAAVAGGAAEARGWASLAKAAIKNEHTATLDKAWNVMAERSRQQLLGGVFSTDAVAASCAMRGHLAGLAGPDRLETLAVGIVDDDREDGDDAYEEALGRVDALSEWVGDPRKWVAFCARQQWELHMMPRTLAMRDALTQQQSLVRSAAGGKRRLA